MMHDSFIREAVAVVDGADRWAVERAWLASLVTREQYRRSVWPRLTFLRHLPLHEFTPSQVFRPNRCTVCGEREDVEVVSPEDLADDAFWFRPINVSWGVAAVKAFAPGDDSPSDNRVDEGRAILHTIADAISDLPATAQLSELDAALVGKLKSNKLERTIVLEALGYAGALLAAEHPSYASAFISYDDAQSRQPAETYKKEWAYPVRFWTGADGINRDALPLGR